MKRFDLRKLTSPTGQAAFGAVSLVTLLTYTFWHTGGLLANYIRPSIIGYICAFGIEVAVVGLALRIGQERRAGRRPYGSIVVLTLALIVSALANIVEGYKTYKGVPLSIAGIREIDPLQGVILVVATALISVIVFAMSEIIGGDVRRAAQATEATERRERKAQEATQATPVESVVTTVVTPVGNGVTNVIPLTSLWRCECGAEFTKQQAYAVHVRRCEVVARRKATPVESVEA